MESRGGIPGAQWCAANCRKILGGKSWEFAASVESDTQVFSLEPLAPSTAKFLSDLKLIGRRSFPGLSKLLGSLTSQGRNRRTDAGKRRHPRASQGIVGPSHTSPPSQLWAARACALLTRLVGRCCSLR